jgi:hypothetical protein
MGQARACLFGSPCLGATPRPRDHLRHANMRMLERELPQSQGVGDDRYRVESHHGLAAIGLKSSSNTGLSTPAATGRPSAVSMKAKKRCCRMFRIAARLSLQARMMPRSKRCSHGCSQRRSDNRCACSSKTSTGRWRSSSSRSVGRWPRHAKAQWSFAQGDRTLQVSGQKFLHNALEAGRVVQEDVVVGVRNLGQLEGGALRLSLGDELRRDA